jgi:RNA polymerase sigma-70 factor, ECF subfamily
MDKHDGATGPAPPHDALDDVAFERLFRAEYASLVRFMRNWIDESATAEDLVQDVFAAAWRNRSRLDGGAPRAYLFRAARNRALNHLRDRRVRRAADHRLAGAHDETLLRAAGAPPAPRADAALEAARTAAAIRQAVDALPTRCRMIFRMSRDHGLSYREIAASLGLSVKTVETQMGRALQALRRSLEPHRP